MSLAVVPITATTASHCSGHSLHKHSSNSHVRPALPPIIAWLEHATLDVSVTQHHHKRDVRYVLAVHHKPSRTKWALSRSFDEYRQFQARVLAALQSGHACRAECPWLYTFVTSYFPKTRLFRSASARVTQFRCVTLNQYLRTIQTVLLDRNNVGCNVLQTNVASVFAEFLCGGAAASDALPLKQWAFAATRSRSRDSLDSQASTSDEEAATNSSSTSNNSSFVDDAVVCGVCDVCVDGYTTTLSCGHTFHDECILPKLNESLQCPTCGHAERLEL